MDAQSYARFILCLLFIVTIGKYFRIPIAIGAAIYYQKSYRVLRFWVISLLKIPIVNENKFKLMVISHCNYE